MVGLLVVLALVALFVGLFTAVKWLIIIAVALAIVAIIRGFVAGGTGRHTRL